MADEYKPSPGGDPDFSAVVSTGKPSLAHLSVVDGLVRRFVSSVLLAKSNFQAGHPGFENPLPGIEAEARRMGDIIMGRDPGYDAQPWNNPSRLGSTLKVLLPAETKHYGDPGAALFMFLANQTLNASEAMERGASEASTQERLAAVVEDVVARIMGVR